VKHGLITHEDFYQNMRSKMLAAAKHDASIPFTEMSTHVLTKYKKEYPNVYQQGALIGMALDLKLLHLSNGSMDLQKLLRLMASEYGPDRPFEDARLFEELGRISGHPEVVSFLYRHVAGTTPLPFDTLLAYAGVYYQPEVTETTVSGGNVGVGYNPRRDAMVVSGSSRMDEFGKALGLMDGDELVSWAGEAITKENVREVIEQFKQRTTPGQEVVVVVNRKNAKDRYKTITLRAKAIATTRTRRHAIEPMTHLTDAQRNLRLLWIGS
jgi:predicted metalloprotease with PDZ domain